MADNVAPEAVVSAAAFSFATDDISTVHYPIIKLAHGALDSATIVSTSSGLPVQMQGTWNITNAGTFAVQVDGAALTALQLIDDVVFAEDAAHSTADKGVQVLTVRKDTAAATSGTDGDYQPPVSNARGATWVAIEDGAGGQITSFGGGTQYTEDAAAAANPVGTATMLVRTDTPATQVSADGDNVALRGSNYGAAYVTLVDNAGSFLSVGGGTQYTEDAAAAADPVGNAINLIRKDTPATITSADGDNVSLRGSNYGAAYVTLIDNGGNFLSVGGGTQYTEDAAAAADPVGNAINLVRQDTLSATTVSADGDNIALRGASTGAAYVEVTAGTTKLGSATDGLLVNLGANNDVTVTGTVTANLAAGTNNIGDVDVLSIAAGDNNIGNVDIVTMPNVTLAAGTNTNEVVGDAAHDAAAAGNPLLMGAYASAAAPTDVSADADAVRIWALRSGAQVIQPSFAGVLATTGNGASGTGVQRVTIANDSTGLISVNPGTAANWGVYVEDAAETAGGNLSMAGSVRRDTAASSAGTSGDNATINTDATGGLWVAGSQAEDAAAASGDRGFSNLGVRNDTPNTALTSTDADYGHITIDRVGGVRTALYETDFAVLGTNHVKKYYTNAGAVTDGIVWSPAAGKRWYVTDIIINTSAAATVTLEDDKAGGDEAVAKFELAANSGIAHSFATPLFSGEDAADLLVTTSAGNIYITVTGYEV